MELKYTLTAILSGVDHDAISLIGDVLLSGNLTATEKHMSKKLFVLGFYLFQARNSFFWNDEYVARTDRIDIPKGQTELILIEDICLNFFTNYLVKNGLLFVHQRR